MTELFSDPALLPWFFVLVLGFVGEFTGFRGAAMFIGLPAMATGIGIASLPDFSVPEQILAFALFFGSHAAFVRFLTLREGAPPMTDSDEDTEVNT